MKISEIAVPMLETTPEIASPVLVITVFIPSKTLEIASPAVVITWHSVPPTTWTIFATAFAITLTRSPTAARMTDIALAKAAATCEAVFPTCWMTGGSALINPEAKRIPAPTSTTAAPRPSIPGIAAAKGAPSRAKTAANPPTTTPKAAMAIAPSLPVFAIGPIVSAIADTDAAKTAIPIALSFSLFPISPKTTASPATTAPKATSGATAVVPSDANGTNASARAARDSVIIATAAPTDRSVFEILSSFLGLAAARDFVRTIMPALRATTAITSPAITPIAAGPAFANAIADWASRANPAEIIRTPAPIRAKDFADASICFPLVFPAAPTAFSPAATPNSFPTSGPTTVPAMLESADPNVVKEVATPLTTLSAIKPAANLGSIVISFAIWSAWSSINLANDFKASAAVFIELLKPFTDFFEPKAPFSLLRLFPIAPNASPKAEPTPLNEA